jgi:hypothetical protein
MVTILIFIEDWRQISIGSYSDWSLFEFPAAEVLLLETKIIYCSIITILYKEIG